VLGFLFFDFTDGKAVNNLAFLQMLRDDLRAASALTLAYVTFSPLRSSMRIIGSASTKPISPVTATSTLSMPRLSISSSMVVMISPRTGAMPLVAMLNTTRYFLLPSRSETCRCALSLSFLSSLRFHGISLPVS